MFEYGWSNKAVKNQVFLHQDLESSVNIFSQKPIWALNIEDMTHSDK